MFFGKKRSPADEKAPDNVIVGRVLSGEREAFNTLVLRWLPSAHACAFSHLANHTEAEDATQEAFIKAYQLLDQLRDADKFGAWLIAIVRNASNRLSSRRNRETALTAEHEANAVAPAPDMGRLEMQQRVRDQVLKLEEADREVLMLHYFTGKSTPEIGELLGISADAVRKRLQRAREALGERLVTEAAQALQPPRSVEERSRAIYAAIAVCRVTWKTIPKAGTAAQTGNASFGSSILANKLALGTGIVTVALLIAITVAMKPRAVDAPSDQTPKAKAALVQAANESSPDSTSSQASPDKTSATPKATKAMDAAPAKGPEPTRIVRGVIRDREGHPVAGARIDRADPATTAAKSDSRKPKVTSDAGGQYKLEWTDTLQELNIYTLRFDRERIKCAAMPLDVDVEIQSVLNLNTPSSGRAKFPGASMVTVTDGAGAPLSGVTARDRDANSSAFATTNAVGAFRVDSTMSGKEIQLELDGYAPETIRYQPGVPISVVMRRPGSLRVHVTKGGAAVSGANVRVSGDEKHTAATDKDGIAQFDALPAPLAYSVGLADQADAYELSGRTSVEEGKTVDCELHVIDRYPATLRGRILDADGSPVKGVELTIQQADSPAYPRKVIVNDEGAFEIGLTLGTNRVIPDAASIKRVFADQGLDDTWYEVKVEKGANDVMHDFRLKRIKPHVTIRLIDAGGTPVTRAEIAISPGLQADNSRFVVSAPDGTFTTTREYASAVRAIDMEHKRIGFATIPAGADVVDVRLADTLGSVRARTVDQTGKGVPSVQVYMSAVGGQDGLPQVPAWFGSGQFRGVSDTQGQLVLERLPNGASYSMSAWASDFAVLSYTPSNVVVANATPAEVTITLGAAAAAVSGRVVDESGAGVANALVFINSADLKQLNFNRQAFTDESGRFSTTVVKGEYDVWASRMTPNAIGSEAVTVTAPADDVTLVIQRAVKTRAPQSPELVQAQLMMKQVALVFKMFAGDHKDKYPRLSKTFGVFSPDLSQIYPEYVTDATTADRLGGKLDVKTSYLGFLANDEESGMRVLDAYEQLGPEGLSDPETLRQYVESHPNDSAQGAILPLQEGIERFVITDINDPQGSSKAQSTIPLTWEMPGPLRPDGGYVTYMDGHVEWVSYPGKFPMTEEFIGRLNALARARSK